VTFTDWLEALPTLSHPHGQPTRWFPRGKWSPTTASSACRMWLVTGFGTGLTRQHWRFRRPLAYPAGQLVDRHKPLAGNPRSLHIW